MGAQTQSHSSAFTVSFNGAQQNKLSVLQANRTQSSSSFVSSLRPAPVATAEGSFRFQQRQGTATMNQIADSTQKQKSRTDQNQSQEVRNQPFVLDSDFANQNVGSTIDEIFSAGQDIQTPVSAQTQTVAPKTGFRGLIERAFNSPNFTMVGDDIYASDLTSQQQYTPIPVGSRTKLTKGTFEKWSDMYESKANIDARAFQRVDRPAEFVSPAHLAFGRSAGVRATAPNKSVIMMSQAMHESH